jgi:hypothetical protein
MTLARRKEVAMTAIWDKAFLKQHARDAREDALAAQSDNDWKSAEMLLEREMSDSVGGCIDCPLPACRRAFRCVGNRPICMPRCKVEFEPGVEQELFEQFYAEIQQERRDAAAEGRAPDVERVMTHRVHEEEVEEEIEIEDEPPSTPARDEPERNSPVPAVPRSEVAPSRPPPQQLRKPELPADPPAAPVLSAAPPPPAEPEPQMDPEVAERVNRIWADYVAGKRPARAGPRIRSLASEDSPRMPGWWPKR